MHLKPIKKRKRVYQDIIEQIKTAIEEEEIKPGEKLPSERYLAETLGVSRTSVKEAITVLESTDVITVRPGVGMFLNMESQKGLLNKLSQIIADKRSGFKDLFELRQAIEVDAAYYAASRITEEQKEKLTNVYKNLKGNKKQVEFATEEDYQFHYTIVEIADNHVMLEVMNLMADRILQGLKESKESSIKSDVLTNEVMKEHENIFLAIMNNNPEEAKRTMWEHHQGIKQRHFQSIFKT
ncbi:FadR/GntR family transcriptional regulator [Virgibacillus ndiopensis]|uniref:FadR/GntR family transcriptional regulator n=1 Tax=Virgibacillus ndiopensis TaxID=2004408 RepID=UPI000C085341|nr:FadR/GntR family transcriptional regulator [Virgibacillus ndiopensis]